MLRWEAPHHTPSTLRNWRDDEVTIKAATMVTNVILKKASSQTQMGDFSSLLPMFINISTWQRSMNSEKNRLDYLMTLSQPQSSHTVEIHKNYEILIRKAWKEAVVLLSFVSGDWENSLQYVRFADNKHIWRGNNHYTVAYGDWFRKMNTKSQRFMRWTTDIFKRKQHEI